MQCASSEFCGSFPSRHPIVFAHDVLKDRLLLFFPNALAFVIQPVPVLRPARHRMPEWRILAGLLFHWIAALVERNRAAVVVHLKCPAFPLGIGDDASGTDI